MHGDIHAYMHTYVCMHAASQIRIYVMGQTLGSRFVSGKNTLKRNEGWVAGVLAAPVAAHMVCNFWGFPDFEGVANHPRKRGNC